MKRERAYIDNRRKRIIEFMQENPEVKVSRLSEIFEVSPITIRRDLEYLEKRNQLTRIYGGAVPSKKEFTKEDEVLMYRELIARYAASLVRDGDSLFINTSSNALQMLKYVESSQVMAITNNGKAITIDHSPDVSIILTGGELRNPKDAMVGDFAIRNLQTIFAKKAFIGCSGISPVTGMTTEIANEVSINELMIDHAMEAVYILADHTKIGRSCSFTSCTIDKIKYLITDEKAPEDVLELLRAKGVQIHQVHKEKEE